MQPIESCLHCQFLCRILKALFYQTSSRIKLFLQKNAKFLSAEGSAPRPPKTAPPLRISGYVPGYNTSEFLRFCAKNFYRSPPPKFSGSAAGELLI